MTDNIDENGRRPRRRPQADQQGSHGKPFRGESRSRDGAPRARSKKGQAQTPRTHERVEGAERIAKVIARAGVCSRRDAEKLVEEGRVEVNGRRLDSPAFNVAEGDRIVVDGRPLAARERTRLWLFHKPRGYVTTDSDPEGRPTIHDVLPPDLPRVVTIGRLDINTEGLLLLTNDGGLARVLELPATGWLRRYRVRAHGETHQAALDGLRNGVTIDGVDYAGVEATFDRQQGANSWITLGLREGKNREVKRLLEHVGLDVNRLIRISFGPFQLADLGEGAVEEVRTRVLRDQLGPSLAEAASADFDAPVGQPEKERPRGDRHEGRGDRRDGPSGERPHHRPEAGDRREAAVREEPRARKHVSALRRDRDEKEGGGRRRVERAETADRAGRTVKVERIKPVDKPNKRPDGRNARRFAAEGREGQQRDGAGDRNFRARPARDDTKSPSGNRGGFGRREDGSGGKPFARKFDGDRPPRGPRPDAGARPERPAFRSKPRFEGDRPPRGPRPDDGARPERPAFRSKPRFEGERPPRGPRPDDGARPERPAFRSKPRFEGDRPPRGPRPDAGARPERPAFRSKPRFEGDRPPRGPRPDDAGRPERPVRAKPRFDGERRGGGAEGRDERRSGGPRNNDRPGKPRFGQDRAPRSESGGPGKRSFHGKSSEGRPSRPPGGRPPPRKGPRPPRRDG